MPEQKLLCPHLLMLRDLTAKNPDADCYCIGPRCAHHRWAPSTGALRREGYCGPAGPPDAYRKAARVETAVLPL